MSGTPVRILLARHGETVSNVEGRWQGQTDSPLTERGVAQARVLAHAIRAEPIAAVYSSDLGRAMQTAGEVAAPLGLEVRAERRLREMSVGVWAGRNRAEIEALFPGGWTAWAEAPAGLRIPEGETLLEAQVRALAFFAERMPDHADETVAIISHGAVCQTLLVEAMGGSVEDLWLKQRVDNCQISRLEWTAASGLKLIELADTRHLAEVGSLRTWRTTDSA